LFVLSHGVARTSGKRPKSILIIRKGVLIMFYPLYAVRYTLYEMIHAHKPLFAKQGKVLNLGHLYFDIVSNFVLRISYFASLGISTTVESSLQIKLFMQNEPKFRKVKLNVNKVLTRDYEQLDTWSIGKNEPKTNPKRTQTNPIQSQYKPNSNQIKANFSSVRKGGKAEHRIACWKY